MFAPDIVFLFCSVSISSSEIRVVQKYIAVSWTLFKMGKRQDNSPFSKAENYYNKVAVNLNLAKFKARATNKT